MLSRRDNTLRAIRFERPEWIPVSFYVNGAYWSHVDHDHLQDLMEEHPLLFPDYRREARVIPYYSLCQRANEPYTDPWRCVWSTPEDGLTGAVHGHPLESWDAWEGYTPPSPEETDGTFPWNWDEARQDTQERRRKGELVRASLPHGHTFLRLQDLRGYENLLCDMADREPRLWKLIEMVEEFNDGIVRRWIELEPDIMGYPDDLGMQVGPMLSPDQLREYLKPSYSRLMRHAREKGVAVHMHSDGDIRTLVDDLVEGGVEVINLQDLVNGVEWIAERFKGRVCVDLDVDRQRVTVHGTPADIDALIRYEVESLGSREGGLMMIFGLYPGTPIENAGAVMDAMERYAGYYS